MNNNSCNHQNEPGNFCSQCGVALREKCPECGEMERIGRVVCEKKVAQASEAQKKAIDDAGIVMSLLCFCAGLCIGVFGPFGMVYIAMHHAVVMALGFVSTICLGVLVMLEGNELEKRIKEKARQKFLKENPEYAEILKQAEEEK